MRNAYGDRCYGRFKRFEDGRESVDDDGYGAHVTKANEIVRSDRRLTVREIAESYYISVGFVS